MQPDILPASVVKTMLRHVYTLSPVNLVINWFPFYWCYRCDEDMVNNSCNSYLPNGLLVESYSYKPLIEKNYKAEEKFQ